ncbi:MAG: hypothetical protein PHQ59_03985 [Candidatus Daviesbacteria bacterium]|nr:hypothetical protein [Candidatus Daviesbacteria bacterium]
MIQSIGYYLIFGKPVIMYFGIVTLLSFLFTALIGFMNYHGIHKIPFKWHPRMAALSITLAVLHGIMGLLIYF